MIELKVTKTRGTTVLNLLLVNVSKLLTDSIIMLTSRLSNVLELLTKSKTILLNLDKINKHSSNLVALLSNKFVKLIRKLKELRRS